MDIKMHPSSKGKCYICEGDATYKLVVGGRVILLLCDECRVKTKISM